jgi:AraC-like DNA-binding protein
MLVQTAAPDPRLRHIVRHYQSREADFGDASARIALPARTDVLVEFYFSLPHLLELQRDGRRERAPLVAAVGPQTFRRVDLLLGGTLSSFTIHFTPTGLHALLGVPMSELTDAGIDAGGLFGARAIAELHDRLNDAPDLAVRAALTDTFLLERAGQAPRCNPVIERALALLQRDATIQPGSVSLADVISPRHFRRLFEQQVGMPPKRYARVVRLEAALVARRAAPERRWADIAQDCGWFDQAHMDKDFRALAGAAPSAFPIGR